MLSFDPRETPESEPLNPEPEHHAKAVWNRFLGRGAPREWRRSDWVALALFAAVVLLYFLPVMAPGMVLSSRVGDITTEWWWQRGYLGSCLKRFYVPQINPWVMGGMPYIASSQSALFYPPNWFFAVCDRVAVLNWQTIVHFWAGLAGMYYVARWFGRSICASFSAALVFGFSGFAILHWWQGHLVFVSAWPWTPLLVLAWAIMQQRACESRSVRGLLPSITGFAAALALQLFSGHPQIAWYTLIIVAWLQACWLLVAIRHHCVAPAVRSSLALVGACLFAGALAAVQALPMLLFTSVSVRSSLQNSYFYFFGSHAPGDMLTTFAPFVFGGVEGSREFLYGASSHWLPTWAMPVLAGGRDFFGILSQYWEVGAFVGLTTVLVLIVAVFISRFPSMAWSTLGLLVFAWWIALGNHGGLYVLALRYVPSVSLFRCPGRAVYVVTFCFAVLSAFSIDSLMVQAQTNSRALARKLLLVVLIIAIAVAAYLIVFPDGAQSRSLVALMQYRSRMADKNIMDRSVPASCRLFQREMIRAFATSVLVLAVMSLALFQRTRRVVPFLLTLLLVYELTVFSLPYRVGFRPDLLMWPRYISDVVKDSGMYRFAAARALADLDQPIEWRAHGVWGHDPANTTRYAYAVGRTQGYKSAISVTMVLHLRHLCALLDSMGAKYLLGPPESIDKEINETGRTLAQEGWKRVLEHDIFALYQNPSALPRVRLAGSAEVIPYEKMVTRLVTEDHADSTTVWLESMPEAAARVTLAGAASGTSSTLPGDLKVLKDDPELLEAQVDLVRPGWLVKMDQYLPGWTAEVDGKPATIYPANAIGKAVFVDRGRHLVKLRYFTPGLAVGAVVSIIAWSIALLLFAWGVLSRRASRKHLVS